MVSTVNIALSGLKSASQRLEISAKNVANAQSTHTIVNGQRTDQPYTPQQPSQTTLATGGVITAARDVNPATVKQFNPQSDNADADGVAEIPNVDLEQEAVNQVIAAYDYKANLKALKTQLDLEKSLLDIKS